MEHELTIGEVARRSGVRASALRYYEQVGLLPPPKRVNTQRRYTADVLQRVALIKAAQRAGFMLADIMLVLEGIAKNEPLSASWNRQARKRLVEIDTDIRHLLSVKQMLEASMDCGCVQLDECVLYMKKESQPQQDI
jgi:MerR family transcriptional regulator, redox-sensitive transcriptional activator SoxR